MNCENLDINDDEDQCFRTVPTPRISIFTRAVFSNDEEDFEENFFQRAKSKFLD